MAGCAVYTERFAYTDRASDTNIVFRPSRFKISTNDLAQFQKSDTNGLPRIYLVHIRYATFFQWGKASRLQTTTATRDFVRTVNGEGLESKVDAAAMEAGFNGITKAALEYFAPIP